MKLRCEYSASRLKGQQLGPVKIGHISGMALYPKPIRLLIFIYGLIWDHQRIDYYFRPLTALKS